MPLGRCLDRPEEEGAAAGEEGRLAAHLAEVGRLARALGGDMGVPEGLLPLLQLAGLLHDAGKARAEWQRYVRDPSRRRGRVPHAYWGTALFFSLATEWRGGVPDAAIVHLTLDIAEHHGLLGDVPDRPPWWARWDGAADLDLAGLAALLRRELPQCAAPWMDDAAALQARVTAAEQAWRRAVHRLGGPPDPRLLVRRETAALIAADRFAVAALTPIRFEPGDASVAEAAVAAHAARRSVAVARGGSASAQVAAVRTQVQAEVLARFRAHPHEPVYQLVLPTGAGKTLAALRVALEAMGRGRRRLVYVAPYLSVLSQAAREISQASGLPVLEHHHLALPVPPQDAPETEAVGSDRALLAMAAWQAPVVATTFNQLFAAFFPRAAQETLRLPALREALVVVDEPQVMDAGSWPLFCAAAEAVADTLGTQFLLVSATMPPWQGRRPAWPLAPEVTLPSRYRLVVDQEARDAVATAALALAEARARGTVAVILNTIADAAAVYREVCAQGDGLDCVLVHGAMTALHKAAEVRRARVLLHRAVRRGRPTVVVATQVLEAGVDLSVRALLRARPVLPSVVQAAGRANRHAEGEPAPVRVFPFVRQPEGGTAVDTRTWVYRDAHVREETDRALAALGADADEPTVRAAVAGYYQRLLARVPVQQGVGQALREVGLGRWSVVAGIGPFGKEPPGQEVFVPRDDWNDRGTRALLAHFRLRGAQDVWERQQQVGFRRSLGAADHRRWSALLHRFTVALPLARALSLAANAEGPGPLLLADAEGYSREYGMSQLMEGRGDEAIFY
jgi:CRISPR-associated helicase Cas3/CRISPR-associated endonuclease Cas3-HD